MQLEAKPAGRDERQLMHPRVLTVDRHDRSRGQKIALQIPESDWFGERARPRAAGHVTDVPSVGHHRCAGAGSAAVAEQPDELPAPPGRGRGAARE